MDWLMESCITTTDSDSVSNERKVVFKSQSEEQDSIYSKKKVTYDSETSGYEKIKQKFNPIYSNEEESNQIISFISANLVVELEPRQIKKLDGYLVIRFVVDTLGNFEKLKVAKSYNNWVDYAMLGAMKTLPSYGKIFYNKKGEPIEKSQQVVFSFGSYVKNGGTYGFQNDLVRNNTQDEINKQRDEYFAKVKQHWKQWGSFTDVNSRLEYDIKDGLKQEANRMDIDDLENSDLTPPIINPTITITDLD